MKNLSKSYLIIQSTPNAITNREEALVLRRYADRLQRFYQSKRWKEKNGEYFITQKQIEIKIYQSTYGFKIKMGQTNGKYIYRTINEAKKKVFDFIDSGEADIFFMYKKRKV